MQIYINRDGQQFGPLTIEQVNQALVTGQLLPTDLAFHEGLANWTPLTQIQGVILPGQPGQQAIPAQLVSAGAPAEPAAEIAVEVAAPVAAGGNKQLFLYIGIGAGVLLIGFLVWYFLIRPPTVETPKPRKKVKKEVVAPPTPEQPPEPYYKKEDLPTDFTFQNVRDIFENKCATCHKPDSKKTDLDLKDLAGINAAIEGGKIIKKSEPMKSGLITRIEKPKDDPDVMPPDGKGDPLTDDERKTLFAWILAGAKTD